MRVVVPGHAYLLDVLDSQEPAARPLIFVQRVGPHYPGNVAAHPGSTSQEVLRALIDRADYVNRQIPCLETELGRNAMATALALFEIRAARVKGRALAADAMASVLATPTCPSCGHVLCAEHGGKR